MSSVKLIKMLHPNIIFFIQGQHKVFRSVQYYLWIVPPTSILPCATHGSKHFANDVSLITKMKLIFN